MEIKLTKKQRNEIYKTIRSGRGVGFICHNLAKSIKADYFSLGISGTTRLSVLSKIFPEFRKSFDAFPNKYQTTITEGVYNGKFITVEQARVIVLKKAIKLSNPVKK